MSRVLINENEEDSPTANECTSLALVDDAPSQSALLIGESQDCGVEATISHEGACSAAPVAQNEKSSKEAIANQTQEEAEASNPASLLVENSVLGGEVKTFYEGESSAASVPSPEKWSHEAIVARANARPVRREKLNRAANSGENPGFDFLQECWNDDPALEIVIKKLLVEYPQWGVSIVNGVLVKWDE